MNLKEGRDGAYQLMDAARAAAAAMVAFSHVRDLFLLDYAGKFGSAYLPFYFLAGFGHAGVVIFFVLSGFWITGSVVRRTGEGEFWTSYLVDRLARLWIVLIPALMLGGVLDAIGIYGLNGAIYFGASGAHSIGPTVVTSLSPQGFAANALFLQTLLYPTFGSNGPLWSLAYEFWFYLWFPALWIAVRFRRPSLALAAFAIGLLNPMLYLGFVSWLCGSVLFALVQKVRWEATSRMMRLGLLISGSIAFVAVLTLIRVRPSLWLDPLLSGAFAWFLLGIVVIRPSPSRNVRHVARYGASSSFSLYAIHYPLAALLASIVTGGVRLPPGPASVALVLGVTLALIMAGKLFSLATEAHTGQARKLMRAAWTSGRRQVR